MPSELLLQAVQVAAADLDTDNRAWVIGVGRLVDNVSDDIPDENDIREILANLYSTGDYPAGQLAYVPDYERAEVNPAYRMVTVAAQRDGAPYVESKIGFGMAGFVAQGVTRSGVLTDKERAPSHVLLVDVEAAIADTISIIAHTCLHRGYSGECALVIGVASAVPGQPLRLRALDEHTGELMPADPALDAFEPLLAVFTVDAVPRRPVYHKICWDLAVQAAAQFGVRRPQLMYDPTEGTPEADPPRRNPFEARPLVSGTC